MAGQIRITPDIIRTRASELKNEGKNLEILINRIQEIIFNLQDEWEGETSRMFVEQFNSLKPSVELLYKLIGNMGDQCEDTADALESLDKEIASSYFHI